MILANYFISGTMFNQSKESQIIDAANIVKYSKKANSTLSYWTQFIMSGQYTLQGKKGMELK